MRTLQIGLIVLGACLGVALFYEPGAQGLAYVYGNLAAAGKLKIENPNDAALNPFTRSAMAVIGGFVGSLLGSLAFRFISKLVGRWDDMHGGEKANIFIGCCVGVIITVPFMVLFNSQGIINGVIMSLGLMVLISAVAVFALKSMEEVLPWSRNFGRGRRSNIKIFDTNVIIDGRIYDIVRTGFLDGQMYVPKFVLHELQYIADNADPLRRQRGRRGLDVLKQLQSQFTLEVGSHDRLAPEGSDGVDGRLVRLARALGADLVTNDHNLNRVAELQDVRVLNINDLAVSVRFVVLPGESMEVHVQREGSQIGQGVGYLEDGTMVVVDGGKRAIGQDAIVVVNQVHQSERGKMIFAELPPDSDVPEEIAKPRR
ncbi:MAG: TRAM domain-containing protein [Armatimonadetes bacterium]|nr:TRAM domain-containing protein [Armatimonadota bacterium]